MSICLRWRLVVSLAPKDVRDFISLTEQKMSLYLIINAGNRSQNSAIWGQKAMKYEVF